MKTERWYQRLTRHGLPGLALRTLLIYVVITLLALDLVLSIATPDTYRQMELLYGLAMLAVTIALTAWLVTYYVAQAQHSEARYRQLVEQVADGIFVCSR